MNLHLFKEKLEEFLVYLDVERNLSLHTQRAYKSDLEQFYEFWHRISKQEKNSLTAERALERFFISLYHKKITNNSIARKISCFQSFEKFLAKQNITLKLNLYRPRIEQKLPIFLSVDEIFYLLDDISEEKLPTRKPYRDKAIFELLYATGIRCSELVSIKLYDIDFAQKTIRILGKGKKERFVLFGSQAQKRVEAYLQTERPKPADTKEHLFLNSRNEQLTSRTVQRIIAMFRQFLTLGKAITPHKLRHSFATHLLNQGTDLRIVQELLGHTTLASTEKYTHVSLERLAQICDTLHPIKSLQKNKHD